MKSSMSCKYVNRTSKTLSPAVQKQLNYMNPKGASNRKLPHALQRIFLDRSGYNVRNNESLSPISLPFIETGQGSHSELIKSTKTMQKLVLVGNKDLSPVKTFKRDLSKHSLKKISFIVESCEQISKINKDDIQLTDTLSRQNKDVFEKADEFIKEQGLENEVARWIYRFHKRKTNKKSIDTFKKESLATSYYVEKILNKTNSSKKLKERIMPWKKIVI